MRFAYLDGIRGMAALFVLARHWDSLFGFGFHFGHLAVDLFFMLSGFVIAHAYDSKLRSGAMSSSSFMAVRIARLYPVYALSMIVALAIVFAVAPPHNVPPLDSMRWLVSGALSLFLLPFPGSLPGFLFPLNASAWSLFDELVLNGAYAYGRRLLSDRVLAVIAVLSAALLVVMGAATGTIDHGYRTSLATIAGGLTRATFGIAVGLLLYRHRAVLAPLTARVSPWTGVALVAVVMMFPAVPGFNPVIELVSVFVVFPVAIMVAAGGEPRHGWQMRTMVALGIASYPVYLFHLPLGNVLMLAAASVPEYSRAIGFVAAAGLVLLSLQIERHVDIPARGWLRQRLLRHARPAAA